MRAVRIHKFGAPEVVVIDELPLPEPGPGEVRVRVEASSVAFTDTLIRAGNYPDVRGPLPLTLGYDLVGVVDAVGPGVTAWVPGDRVADLTVTGANATYALRAADGLVRVPAGVDAAEAVSLVLSGLTAYQALVRVAGMKAGQTVLVQGGMGAVGQAAIAVARQLGARVMATARASQADALRALGAEPFDFGADWEGAVRAAGPVDVVVDGAGEGFFLPSRRVLRPGGHLVALGLAAGLRRGDGALKMIASFVMGLVVLPWWPGKRTTFYNIAHDRVRHPEAFAEDLGVLFSWLEQGAIRPVVAERVGFADVARVHAALQAGGLKGKVVLVPDEAR
jgi:NADPH2:quinone reductase